MNQYYQLRNINDYQNKILFFATSFKISIKQIDIIRPGAYLKSTCNVQQWNNYTLVLTTFEILVYQTQPFKYLHSIQCPKDTQVKQQDEQDENITKESSGITSFAVNKQGNVVLATQAGNIFVYKINDPVNQLISANLSIDKRGNSVDQIDRVGNQKCLYGCIQWYDSQDYDIIYTFNIIEQNLIFLNLKNNIIFNLNLNEQINTLAQLNQNQILLGTTVAGKLYCITNVQDIVSSIKDQQAQKVQAKIINLTFNTEKTVSVLELKQPINQGTIYTTPYLHWVNIYYLTCLSCQIYQNTILTVWYTGFIFLFDQDFNVIGSKHVSDVTCACWVQNGLIAFCTSTGKVQIVSLQFLLQQNKKEFDDVFMQLRTNKITFDNNKKMEQKLFYKQQKQFDQTQIINEFQLCNEPLISCSSQNNILTCISSNGQTFIYDLLNRTLIYESVLSHQNTVFSLKVNETSNNTFITVSSDSTAKIYNNMKLQATFGTTQISTIVNNKTIQYNDTYSGFISVAFNPKEQSSLVAIGTLTGSLLIVDIYRNKVYKEFQLTQGRVFDICWYKSTIIAVTEQGQIYQINSETAQQKLIIQLNCQIRGCDISCHDQLLACAGSDGYLRVFTHQSDKYEQIGKFSVSQSQLYHVTFNKCLPQTVAISSDDGAVNIYRYDASNNNFKVQRVSSLMNNKSRARAITFNNVLANIIAIGKWNGFIDVFDWVQNKLIAQIQIQQDVYGLQFDTQHPLQLYVTGRGITISSIYLSQLSEQIMLKTILTPLDDSCVQLNIKTKQQYIQCQEQLKDEFLKQLKSIIRKPSYSYMKSHQDVQIISESSMQHIMETIQNEKLSTILSILIDMFSYQNSGYKELIKYSKYWTAIHNDITNCYQQYVDDIQADQQFYDEYQMSNGLCLSGRSLRYGALQLGRHYFNALYGETEQSKVDQRFKQQKYKFYEFQRELPQNKIQALQIQWHISVMLLACSGDIHNVKEALKHINSNLSSWFGCTEYFQTQNIQDKLYEQQLSNIEIKILKAVGYWSQTKDISLIEQIIEEICINYPNMLTYAQILQNLSKSNKIETKRYQIYKDLRESKIIRAAMECSILNDIEYQCDILKHNENQVVTSILYLNNVIDESIINKLSLICSKNRIYLQTFVHLVQDKTYWLLNSYMSQYTMKLKEAQKNGISIQSKFDVNNITQQINQIVQYNYDKFAHFILQCQQSDNFVEIIYQMKENDIQQRYNAAVIYLINIVNEYVQFNLKENRYLSKLNQLYEQFSIRKLDKTNPVVQYAHLINQLIVIKQNMIKQLYNLVSVQIQNLINQIQNIKQDQLPQIFTCEGFTIQQLKQMKYQAMWQLPTANKQLLIQFIDNKDIKEEEIGLDNQQTIQFVEALGNEIMQFIGIYI